MAVHQAPPPVMHLKEDNQIFSDYTTLESDLDRELSSLSIRTSMKNMSSPAPVINVQTEIKDPASRRTLPPGLHERRITKEDNERVLDFLRNRFFRDEPLNLAIKLLENENDSCPELDEYCGKSMDEGLSVMIYDDEDNIIAIGLNGFFRKDDIAEDYSIGCENEKFKNILKLLYKADKESNIFSKLTDIDVVLDLKIISVDNTYRGKGLAHFLLQKTDDIARSLNINVVRCACTSAFSAKMMQRMGSTKLYGLKFKDYKIDGKTLFTPDPPHEEISIYYYRI